MRQRFGDAISAPIAAVLALAFAIAATGTGAVLARTGDAGFAAAAPTGAVDAADAPTPPVVLAPVGDPVRVRIPAIGVDAALVRLGLNADGSLQVPPFEVAGWYVGRSRPGEPGPAVVAAHVDSTTGPAVFYRLKHLRGGDLIHVDYGDATVTFGVRESRSFPKSQFPTDLVYGPTEGPELRLVTCDGTFDRTARSYLSNLVVWADPVTQP